MRAVVWDGREIRVCDRPDPIAGEEMAVVRVTLAGVCNTDLEIVRGYMGFRGVLGHELIGVVEAGPESWLGRRVVCEINFACGQCPACDRGLRRHCPNRRVMGILGSDGAFAERVAVPTANLHAVPDSIPDECAVFSEPLAAAFEVAEQLALHRDDWCRQRALVLGDGKLGLLIAQVLQRLGASVLAVGRHPHKLRILDARGIETRLIDDWRSCSGSPASVDIAVEATGSPDGFGLALAATRPRGTLIVKSTLAAPHAIDLSPLVIHEIRVIGSRCGPFEPALDALASDEIDVRSLISDRLPLARGDEALRRAAEPRVIKTLLDCT